MGDEKLAKRTGAQKVERIWTRGRPILRWGIALENVGEEWRKRATNRRNRRLLIENVVRGTGGKKKGHHDQLLPDDNAAK